MKSWTEDEFTMQILDLATMHNWLVHHDRPAITSKGWRTAIQGHAGFPDLVLTNARQRRTIYAELKSENGDVSADQALWLAVLRQTPNAEIYLWRPSQLEEIADILSGLTEV